MASGKKTADDVLEDILTIQQAADYLGVGIETAYKMSQRKILPTQRLGGKILIVKREDAQRVKEARELLRGKRGA